MNHRLSLVMFCGIALAATTVAHSQQQNRQTVLLCLPYTPTNSLPSDAFVDAVNQAVRTKRMFVTNCTITVIASEPVLAAWARIILRSYGIGEQEVETATSINPIVKRNTTFAAKIGDCDSNHFNTGRKAEKQDLVPEKFRTAVIVLGNRPLDDVTPTVDMVQRILSAIGYARTLQEPVLILSGAATVGQVSEAKMMALIALSRGFSRNRLVLEEEAWTTGRNAFYTAPIVGRLDVSTVFLVSKKSHLAFAVSEFHKYPVFVNIIPLESPEVREQSIQEMIEYLKLHNNSEVRTRLEALKQDSHGVD